MFYTVSALMNLTASSMQTEEPGMKNEVAIIVSVSIFAGMIMVALFIILGKRPHLVFPSTFRTLVLLTNKK